MCLKLHMLNPTQCLENPSDSVSHLQFPIKGKKERERENWKQKGVGNKNMIYTEWREIEKKNGRNMRAKRGNAKMPKKCMGNSKYVELLEEKRK